MANSFREKRLVDDVEEPVDFPSIWGKKEESEEEAQTAEENSESPRSQEANKLFSKILGGDIILSKWVLSHWRLWVLIMLYIMVAVFIRYRIENLSREKIKVEKNIDLLKEQQIQMQREYQDCIKISRISEMLDTFGIGLIAGPPYELNDGEVKSK